MHAKPSKADRRFRSSRVIFNLEPAEAIQRFDAMLQPVI
jgi:hypothetical protein